MLAKPYRINFEFRLNTVYKYPQWLFWEHKTTQLTGLELASFNFASGQLHRTTPPRELNESDISLHSFVFYVLRAEN